MDTFELSKIAGGVLCALLVIVGFRVAIDLAQEGRPHEPPGFTLPMPQETTGPVPPGGAAAVPAPVDLPAVQPEAFDAAAVGQAASTADATAGAAVSKKCIACHSFDQGGPNKVGPNLWGVVGRPKGSHAGFAYSEAMKTKGGDWTLPDLAAFTHNPKEFVPGTKMIFPGIQDSTDLADLLAYLNTLK
jgi:cytochrome c